MEEKRGYEAFSERVIRWALALTTILVALALAGWAFEVEVLKSLVPGFTSLNPMSALCLLLLAVGVELARNESRLGILPPLLVLGVSADRFLALAGREPIGLDPTLVARALAEQRAWNGVFVVSLSLSMLSLAILTLYSRARYATLVRQILAGCVAAIMLFVFTSFLYRITAVTDEFSDIPVAMNASLVLTLLAFGTVITKPDEGPVPYLLSPHASGQMARRLLIPVLVFPLALGYLRVAIRSLGPLGDDTGLALTVVATIAGIAGAVAWWVQAYERSDARRRYAEWETERLNRLLAKHNTDLEGLVSERTKALEESQEEILERLARAASYRDNDTGEHTQRMSRYCRILAEALGFGERECDLLERAAQLHDLGKIGVPDSILHKPGKLTDEEYAEIKRHAEVGAQLLEGGHSELIRVAEEIARSHHERWDGNGYPQGIAGTDIPIRARIAAVADVFDALTTERPYKHAWPVDDAVEAIISNSGRQFDPQVVDAFVRSLDRIKEAKAQRYDVSMSPSSLVS